MVETVLLCTLKSELWKIVKKISLLLDINSDVGKWYQPAEAKMEHGRVRGIERTDNRKAKTKTQTRDMAEENLDQN